MVDGGLKQFLFSTKEKSSSVPNKNTESLQDSPLQNKNTAGGNNIEPVTPPKARSISPSKRCRSSPGDEAEVPSPNPRPPKITDIKDDLYPPGHSHVAASVATLTASYERLGGSQKTTEEIVAKLQLRFEAVLDEIKTAHEQSILRANARYEALEAEIKILKKSKASKKEETGEIPPSTLDQYVLKADHDIDVKIFLKKHMTAESKLKDYELRCLKTEKKLKSLENILESREISNAQQKATAQPTNSQTLGSKGKNKQKVKEAEIKSPKIKTSKPEAKMPEQANKLGGNSEEKMTTTSTPAVEIPASNKNPTKPVPIVLQGSSIPKVVPVVPQSWNRPNLVSKRTDADGFTEVVGRRQLREQKKAETVIPKLYPVRRRALLANFTSPIKDWKLKPRQTKHYPWSMMP
jgi:hypothetical protein